MATPHINAEKGDFADTVLMPGDPLRAKYIADTYLENVRQVNDVRNMFGYTGTYKGREISVMGHGMGIPSVSIYAKELITDYGVVIGMGACTDSKVNRMRFNDHDFAAIADFEPTSHAVAAAKAQNVAVKVGNIFSADLFYNPQTDMAELMKRYGILGVEMEAAGLYGVAAEFGARALTICTVSDHILKGDSLSSADRQTTFNDMMVIALDTVLRDDAARA